MVDTLTPEARSRQMSRIQGKDTSPEMTVRRILRAMGIGYRLHVKSLPGRPDIVMKGRKKIIEVRGCFWHRHQGCKLSYTPKTRVEFWEEKFEKNVARDHRNKKLLLDDGWDLLVVWECETSNEKNLRDTITDFLKI